MLQLALIIIGIVVLVKGSLKVSDTRIVERPQSIYWGIIIILHGVAMSFLPTDRLVYTLALFGLLLIISAIFVVKGKKIESPEALAKAKHTTRNALILLAVVAVLVGFFYFYFTNL